MIMHIARREVLGHLRSPRFRILCALALGLAATGTYVSARTFAGRVEYADALEAMRQAAIAGERPGDDPTTRFGWRSGRVTADPALRAVRPPSPASVLALGSEATMPGFWQFGTEGLTPGATTDAAERSGGGAVALDFEFLVRAVLSLVALLVAADALAGERETGVLRALLAAPVSRLDVLAGKYVGGLLTLAVPLALGASLAAMVLVASGVPILRPSFAVRLGCFLVGASVYVAAMLALGALVSACCREARTATVALVALWIAMVLVAPDGSWLVARAVRRLTPYELFRQDRTLGIRQLEVERARVLASVWRDVTGHDTVPIDGILAADVRRRYDDARHRPERTLVRRKRALLRALDDARDREQRAQATLAGVLGMISPAVAFHAFAMEAVGTGPSAMRRWQQAVRDHQQRLEVATFDRPFGTELFDARAGYLRITFQPNPGDPADRVPAYGELPSFTPPPDDVVGDLRSALAVLALLAGQTALLLAGSAVVVTRMEI